MRYFPSLDLGESGAALLSRLTAETGWRQDSITLFGKTHKQPRLHAWVGDAGCAYTYSGLRMEPDPWTPLLSDLRARVEEIAGARFNSVLLNLYRDGADSMGAHADDEPELGPRPVIASLSLGAERTLSFTHRARRHAALRLPLAHGSLLVMAGETQTHWKHAISKTARAVGPRINLTFRQIVTAPGGPRQGRDTAA